MDLLPPHDPATNEPEQAEGPLLTPRQLRGFVALFYGLLAIVALVWIRLATGSWEPASLPGREPGLSLFCGAAAGLGVVALSSALLRHAGWLRRLALEIRRMLGPTGPGTAAVIAIFSGVGEELFFRGAMQPVLGYTLTSLIFGLIHVGPDRRFLPWTVFAVVMGFLLGGILLLTGSLLGPMLAHIAINYLNLRRISRLSPSEPLAHP